VEYYTSPQLRLFVLVVVLVCKLAVGGRGDTKGDGEDVVYFLHILLRFLLEALEQCRAGRFVRQRRNLGEGAQLGV